MIGPYCDFQFVVECEEECIGQDERFIGALSIAKQL